jgi:hypothetical protein
LQGSFRKSSFDACRRGSSRAVTTRRKGQVKRRAKRRARPQEQGKRQGKDRRTDD